jgi:ABC-type enterochelin transport system ATPase subunit
LTVSTLTRTVAWGHIADTYQQFFNALYLIDMIHLVWGAKLGYRLLDAGSALDQATEAAINKTLKKVSQGRTVISVTHRLASVADSDIIYVLNHGRLVEQGTHHTRLQRHGLYSKLWRSQGDTTGRSVGIA